MRVPGFEASVVSSSSSEGGTGAAVVRDPRVLKAQLDLAARSMHATRITSPIWAVFAALLCSSQTGIFGNAPLSSVILLPLAVGLVIGASVLVATAYERYGDSENDAASWLHCFVVVQTVGSAAWGLMPWLCWEPGNPVNHLFLAAATMSVIAALVVSRGSNMQMYIASLAPVTAMTSARFLTGDNTVDMVIGALAPFIAFQLWHTGSPLVKRMGEDSRLRFKVGDLARELEEARDDALRKRFEAEAANASKTAFLANMSHELRTPLNAILGFSEIISQECFGPVGSDRYRDYAGDIHSSGAHLLSLINDLLDVAKIEAGRMEIAPHELDAARVLDIALKLIGSKAREKGQELVISVTPGAPALHADERALKQILINLVSNAVKFTPEGGRIEVTGSRAQDGSFQILVRDNGPGVPPDKLDRVFHPFNQVDNRFDRQAGGTGLGLSLVRGLAELHGGRAWMESEYGKGCSVYVTLPVPADARRAAVA
ncbi:MAG TPA: HAMP domain-containing sensor histidine kinase [Rhizomicrobium sp.]|nr:HAMP domain-containing sensor histidine kinase [Rhizomicrobium sp.]